MKIRSIVVESQLLEGGNIFKAPGWTHENPIMLTDRIKKSEVPGTVDYLENLTGLPIADNLLGSTGIAPSSGDIDIAVDKNLYNKDELIDVLLMQRIPETSIKKTGDSVHYQSPIPGTNRFVQVDFMFVPDVDFAKWSMRTAPDSNYKGVYTQQLRADLVRIVNPEWKWNQVQGVLRRADNKNVFGYDPDKIAQGILGSDSDRRDLESVERILAAMQKFKLKQQADVLAAYKTTVANDPNAPKLDEAANPKVGREFQHLEDLVYIEGYNGVLRALDRIQNIVQNQDPLEIKWDGSPAIIFGRNEQGEFHFGDKYSPGTISSARGVYDYYMRNAKPEDVKRKQFSVDMAKLYDVYKNATPENFRGYLEAGLLYKDTPSLNQRNEYTFMPNTVRYNVRADSRLGQRIGNSISGAAATAYFRQLPQAGGTREPVGDSWKAFANSTQVVIIPPQFTETGVSVDSAKIAKIKQFADTYKQNIESFISPEPGLSGIRNIIYSYVNSQVDEPGALDNLGNNFANWIQSNASLSEQQKQKLLNKLKTNQAGALAIFKLVRAIMHLKDNIVLSQEASTLGKLGIRAELKTGESGGEGFVHDPRGAAGPVKLVRRGAFTRANRMRDNVTESYVSTLFKSKPDVDRFEKLFGPLLINGTSINHKAAGKFCVFAESKLLSNVTVMDIFHHLLDAKIEQVYSDKKLLENIDRSSEKNLERLFKTFADCSDKKQKFSVGDTACLLELSALDLGPSSRIIELSGFTVPKRIVSIDNGYVQFADGSVFPSKPFFQLKSWRQCALFKNKNELDRCLTALSLHAGEISSADGDWKFSAEFRDESNSKSLTEDTKHGDTAVVGWGRGMGHKGHMYLVSAVITTAEKIDADPFFVVSETVGPDDPLTTKEKLNIYTAVFPDKREIFRTATGIVPALEEIYKLGYKNVVLVVGKDQVEAGSFNFLSKPTKKTGKLPVPFDKVLVIGRHQTLDPYANEEGPRATPMREILKDPNANTKDKFKVWRDAMPDALSDHDVLKYMRIAASRLGYPLNSKKSDEESENLNEADPPVYSYGATMSPIPGTPESLQPHASPEDLEEYERERKELYRFLRHS